METGTPCIWLDLISEEMQNFVCHIFGYDHEKNEVVYLLALILKDII